MFVYNIHYSNMQKDRRLLFFLILHIYFEIEPTKKIVQEYKVHMLISQEWEDNRLMYAHLNPPRKLVSLIFNYLFMIFN